MKKLLTWSWWKAALERAGSQAAEAVLVAIALSGTFTLLDVDWFLTLGFALGGAITSIVISIGSLPEHDGRALPVWQAILWRAIRTAAASLGGIIATTVADSQFNAFTFDWKAAVLAVSGTVFLAIVKAAVRFPAESLPRANLDE